MKIKLTLGKFFTLAFCVMALVGVVGVLPLLFSKSLYAGLCGVAIIVMNVGLVLTTIFGVRRMFKNILFFLDFAAFVAIFYFADLSDSYESNYLILLVFGGFLAWLSYVGVLYFFLLLGLPFRILGCLMDKKQREKGIFGGTTWVCDNSITTSDGHIHYCKEKTVTFKNGTPSPSTLKGCIFSEDDKHHFVRAGSGSDITSQVGHALEWLGIAVGVIGGIAALIAKFVM